MGEQSSFGRRILLGVCCGSFVLFGMAVVVEPTVSNVFKAFLIGAPGMLVSAVIAGRFVVNPDKETHCRACGYILRGLSEPRCSECGERI